MSRTFGNFVQTVLSKLVENHQWDDPYASMSPQYDPDGEILNFLLDAYQKDMATAVAAYHLDNKPA